MTGSSLLRTSNHYFQRSYFGSGINIDARILLEPHSRLVAFTTCLYIRSYVCMYVEINNDKMVWCERRGASGRVPRGARQLIVPTPCDMYIGCPMEIFLGIYGSMISEEWFTNTYILLNPFFAFDVFIYCTNNNRFAFKLCETLCTCGSHSKPRRYIWQLDIRKLDRWGSIPSIRWAL